MPPDLFEMDSPVTQAADRGFRRGLMIGPIAGAAVGFALVILITQIART